MLRLIGILAGAAIAGAASAESSVSSSVSLSGSGPTATVKINGVVVDRRPNGAGNVDALVDRIGRNVVSRDSPPGAAAPLSASPVSLGRSPNAGGAGMADEFDLVTDWELDAPLGEVWTTLRAVEQWPRWWPSVRQVEPIVEGNQEGVGAIHRLVWQTALPYRLTLTTEVIAVEPTHRIEVRAWGDVEGTGTWSLRSNAEGATIVRYVWRVSVTKPWMRRLLPILKPVFAWNHLKVMDIGGVGLQRHLGERASGLA